MRGFCICVGFQICQGSEYSKIVNMPGFWISRVVQGLSTFVNMTGFLICLEIQLWKGFKYFRIPNMLGFCICKRYIMFWIWLNKAEQCLNKLFWQYQSSEYVWSKFRWVLNMPPVPNILVLGIWHTAQKMKSSIKYFFGKCDQIRRNLWIWSHLLKKSLMENFIF